ncbi:hypothetical protein NXS98_06075 [Fontisphaera persica]|uniref:hypothetical protein n=1 Tax=Fontisphaera persica TaxID=2974023 RepID=UPI0024C02F52|nr:hypothetical protein [Fontisphaera persica]WCJ60691.1 hypothetical protein NXS98_06075 [Fontisphaera persica]
MNNGHAPPAGGSEHEAVAPSSLHEQNVFRCVGDQWELVFNGTQAHYRGSLKGLRYIRHLLAERPLVPVPATQLLLQESGEFDECVSAKELSNPGCAEGGVEGQIDGLVYEEGLVSPDSDFRQVILPEPDRRWVQNLIERLRGDAEARRANGRGPEAQALLEELALAERMVQQCRVRNHDAVFNNQEERNRKSVGNAISRAIEAIRAVHPRLAQHLKDSITASWDCCYSPVMALSWQV